MRQSINDIEITSIGIIAALNNAKQIRLYHKSDHADIKKKKNNLTYI